MNFVNTDAFVKIIVVIAVGDFIAFILNMILTYALTDPSPKGEKPANFLVMAYAGAVLALVFANMTTGGLSSNVCCLVATACGAVIWPLTLWRLVVTPTR